MSSVGTVPPWEFTQEGSFTAPFTVPIPASLEVQPYTATATFDGSGSSGAYVPTITIIGPGGEKLARVQPQTTVAHGASASCTWLPPFGAAASSPTGETIGASFYQDPPIGVIAAGDIVALTWGDPPVGAPNGGGTQLFTFTGGDYTTAIAIATGIYTVSLWVKPGAGDTAEHQAYAEMDIYMAANTDDVDYHGNVPLDLDTASFTAGTVTAVYRVAAGDVCTAQVTNHGANSHNLVGQLAVGFVATS